MTNKAPDHIGNFKVLVFQRLELLGEYYYNNRKDFGQNIIAIIWDRHDSLVFNKNKKIFYFVIKTHKELAGYNTYNDSPFKWDFYIKRSFDIVNGTCDDVYSDEFFSISEEKAFVLLKRDHEEVFTWLLFNPDWHILSGGV